MTCTDRKPEKVPYYYQVRGINPSPGNDWVCEGGQWVWRMSGHEKAQEPKASEKFEGQFVLCKNPVGVYKIGGSYRQVCRDLRGYYYVENYSRFNLSANWAYENVIKPKAKSLIPDKDPAESLLRDPESGKWWGAGVQEKAESLGERAKNLIPDAGGLKQSLQVTGLVIMAFFALLLYIIFVRGKGAEGVSVSAVGK